MITSSTADKFATASIYIRITPVMYTVFFFLAWHNILYGFDVLFCSIANTEFQMRSYFFTKFSMDLSNTRFFTNNGRHTHTHIQNEKKKNKRHTHIHTLTKQNKRTEQNRIDCENEKKKKQKEKWKKIDNVPAMKIGDEQAYGHLDAY